MLPRPIPGVALALLLASGGACILVPIEPGGELAELRAQQRQQAERVASALCASYYGCSCDDRYPPHDDEAECFAQVSGDLLARLEQGIDRDLDYDPACLDAQAELLEALGCATHIEIALDVDLTRLRDAAARCRTYHGILEPGEDDCERLLTARGDDCGPGHACTQFASCSTTEPLGESHTCGDGLLPPCESGLWCLPSLISGVRTCQRPAALGERCGDAGECDFDGWCDASDFTCHPWAAPAEVCEGPDREGPCSPYEAYCDAGTCAALPAEGQPCALLGCALGLRCSDDGLCVPARAFACDFDDDLP